MVSDIDARLIEVEAKLASYSEVFDQLPDLMGRVRVDTEEILKACRRMKVATSDVYIHYARFDAHMKDMNSGHTRDEAIIDKHQQDLTIVGEKLNDLIPKPNPEDKEGATPPSSH